MPTVYIQNSSTGHVLDIRGSSQEQGAEVIMYPYTGNKNQLWKHKDGMFYSKLNKNLVLDVAQSNKSIIIWAAHGGANQKWIVNKEDGTITSESGFTLDVAQGSTAPSARVIGYGKHGGANQLFNVVKK